MYRHRHTETYNGIRIDVRANTRKELLEKVEAKKERINRTNINTNTKLKDFADMYIRTYKAPVVSEKWLQGLFLISDRHIVGSLGNRPISTIKPLEVQKMLNSLDVSSNYMTKIYNLTCQIFKHAYKNGLTATDYTDGLEKPKGRKANTQKTKRTPAFRQESLL